MTSDNEMLVLAERHVRNNEEHVAHRQARVAVLDERSTSRGALLAKQALKATQQTLELEREFLRTERQTRGLEP